MGDAISTLLFQPPPPTRLKESKVIWLDTSRGRRIPAFFIEGPRRPVSPQVDGPIDKDVGMPGGGGSSPQIRCSKDLERDASSPNLLGGGPTAGITLLYSHANAEDLGNIYPWCKFLSKALGVNIFAYDYTGYGLAEDQGDPCEEDCYADIDAAYSYLRDTLRIQPSNIVLYGRSLGSGPSCYLASRTAEDDKLGGPVGGLILHAPFLSVFRIVLESGCTLPGDKFPNVDFAPSIRSPVILIHGTKDTIVPFNHSEQLLEVIQEPCRAKPLFIHGMGHNNVHSLVRPLFVTRLREYLDQHVWPNARRVSRLGSVRTRLGNFVGGTSQQRPQPLSTTQPAS